MLSESMNIAPMTSNYTIPNTVSTSLEKSPRGVLLRCPVEHQKNTSQTDHDIEHQEVLGV
jgi:hypothetical protein